MTAGHQTTKSVAKNVFYGFLTWILPLSLSFVAIPLIVKTLGKKDYGIYVLVLGFVGYSFTFSIGRAITKYIAEYRAKGETEKIRDVISATFFVNIGVGISGALIICLMANYLVQNVFQIDEDSQTKTVTAMYIASAIVFVTMLNQVFNAVLQGMHRFDIYSKIINFNSFALLSGNLFLAWRGFGFLSLLEWNLFVVCVTCSLFVFSAKKLLPEFGISFRFKRETLYLVLRYSFGIIGYQILANFLLLFERGWITRHLGTESLTDYAVPMSLGLYIHGFVSSLVLVIFPLASELNDNKPKLLRLYTKATKIVCFFAVFLASTLIVENRIFLTLWMGASFVETSASLLILHVITFSLAAILTVSWQMIEGLGFPHYNFAAFAICLIISVSLMITLTDNLGTFGVGVARLAGFGTIFFSIFLVEKWFFNKVQIGFWLRLAGFLAVAVACSAFVQILIANNLKISWFSFVLSVFCGGLTYCLTLWILGFVTSDEKILIRGILRR